MRASSVSDVLSMLAYQLSLVLRDLSTISLTPFSVTIVLKICKKKPPLVSAVILSAGNLCLNFCLSTAVG
jgi:hypothetical protein